jgi:hypothetical protein
LSVRSSECAVSELSSTLFFPALFRLKKPQ